MRRKGIALLTAALMIALLVPVAPAGAAGVWSTVADLPTIGEDVFFVDGSTGWALGSDGLIFKSTDGGLTWGSFVSTGVSLARDTHFIDSSNGWVVGATGRIARTTNGGQTWTSSTITTANLRGVHFTDSQHGWVAASDGSIRATSNGGTSWAVQSSGPAALYDIVFADALHGWAVGQDGTIYYTDNSGSSWGVTSGPTASQLQAVHFSDALHGWAVGASGTIIVSDDGGATWTAQSSGTSVFLRDVHFVDASEGWVVGDGGTVLHTTNGGVSWESQDAGVSTGLYGLCAVDASSVLALDLGGQVLKYWPSIAGGVSVTADAPAPTELSLTFSVTAGSSPDGGAVTDSAIDFGTLAANTPKSGSHELQVTTNASNGYQVTGSEDAPLTSGAYSIPDVTGDASDITEAVAGAWAEADTYGFGYTLADVAGSSAAFTTGFKQFADVSAAESAQVLMEATAPTTGDAVELSYKLNIGPSQVQGTYANTVTYIATGNL